MRQPFRFQRMGGCGRSDLQPRLDAQLKNLDEEGDNVAAGGQRNPHSKAHEGFFEREKTPR